MEILNLDCFSGDKGKVWFDKASGRSPGPDGGELNGGVLNPAREHLKLGQYYFRFASSSWSRDRKFGGVWWIDYDTLNTIYRRFQSIGPNPRARNISGSGPAASTFREWLAVSYEWNFFQEIVVGRLMQRLDAYSGAGRTARGNHVFDTRAFGYAPHLSNLFTIKQFCVPEVWLYTKRAFPTAKVMPFSSIDTLSSGVDI